jgi:hypothetical protein
VTKCVANGLWVQRARNPWKNVAPAGKNAGANLAGSSAESLCACRRPFPLTETLILTGASEAGWLKMRMDKRSSGGRSGEWRRYWLSGHPPCRGPIGAASRATDLVVPAQTGIHAVMVHRVVETRNNILLKRFFNKELISFQA